jgi:hypothetical protein
MSGSRSLFPRSGAYQSVLIEGRANVNFWGIHEPEFVILRVFRDQRWGKPLQVDRARDTAHFLDDAETPVDPPLAFNSENGARAVTDWLAANGVETSNVAIAVEAKEIADMTREDGFVSNTFASMGSGNSSGWAIPVNSSAAFQQILHTAVPHWFKDFAVVNTDQLVLFLSAWLAGFIPIVLACWRSRLRMRNAAAKFFDDAHAKSIHAA